MLNLSREFPLDEDIIYLNHAAVAPWPRRTADAVRRFAEENVARGADRYPAWLAREAELRRQCQALINAPSADDIALVKNTSEGLSFVAAGLDWQPGDEIVTSNEEFPSNRIVWEALADRGVKLVEVDLRRTDKDLEAALQAACNDRTRLVAISSVQFASGLRVDLQRLGELCKREGILFCVDAIQSIGALPFDAQACSADFVTADGHKWMLGPEGLGLFYVKPSVREQLRLFEYGWHMTEHPGDYDTKTWRPSRTATRFECGSSNMLGIHALSASLSLLLEVGMEQIQRQVLANADHLFDLIEGDPRLMLKTMRQDGRYAGIVNFTVKNADNDKVFQSLRKQGVVCALRGGGIRFSPHFYTSREQLDRAVALAVAGDP
jgi:cysteine desulfurase/selenocysteine lyase